MSYNAFVFKVMIASPSDVNAERGIVREILGEWNVIHSEKYRIVLLPVGWETHSTPEMGASPQSIINRTVLRECDLLAGIFWTRIGTATEDYISGTVEEIERHINEGKPTMLYFSSAPVMPESVDPDQYRSLREFKNSCKSRGLLESYSDLQDFRSKFSRQIQRKINLDQYFAQSSSAEAVQELAAKPVVTLSREAQELLRSAASGDGNIMHLKFIGGVQVQAGRRAFVEENNSHSAAIWEGVLQELETKKFVQPLGYKREMFKVTREGYEFFDSYLKA
ncbi:hypothetical protein ACOBR2_20385 [Telmatobacter bradus]|uniref:hypothetical protein n=1 Tax=Telmatobacter bradus TaxID=474953 RepID=UPI003B42B58A